MPSAIHCQGLSKIYPGKPPVLAVRGLDLEVESGECFGLLGPNGAGKTTTIEILEGLLEATSGDVEVLGLRWGRDDRLLKQRIGVSLQETKLPDKLAVAETVRLFRSFYATGTEPDEVLRLVGLTEKAKAWTSKLSGGQRQRLAVALALVGDPELLFLDEPTTGLDPQSRRSLWELIRRFRDQGRTVLLTTHYMDEAERLCDRIAIVDQGKVIAQGTPRELIASIGGEHVIEFSLAEVAVRPPIETEALARLSSVRSIRLEDGHFCLTVVEPHIALPALLNELRETGHELTSLTTRHASLEDVFVALTGRHLRDTEVPTNVGGVG